MTPDEPARPPVVAMGMVPTGASGVKDYGRLLAEELRHHDRPVDEVWVLNDGERLVAAATASLRVLIVAWEQPRGVKVVWHYSSFAYALRGVPMPGVLLGLVLRARGAHVVTVLHEPAYPWGRRGLRGRAQSIAQRLALPLVLLGSTEVVVTTERRAAVLRRLPRQLCRPVYTLPVFATVEVAPPDPPPNDGQHWLGVLGYSGDGARPDLLLHAVLALEDLGPVHVVVLGSPGSLSPAGRALRRLAAELGLAHAVEFTDIVPTHVLSRTIQKCDLVLVLNEQGPSSRRTTIAVPLAHAMPMICLDGPDRWEQLVLGQAAVLVPADVQVLASAIRTLLDNPLEREQLGQRALKCYEKWMGIERVAGAIGSVLDGNAPPE